ncbi:MAG: HAMP domain-containing histidine kinase [Syntrophobacterales bacterium]|jgi:signal transduction histidine kinase|nr:HAMP domain-containing histidine kinase [Syntrophobacterales bacterium]
MNPESRQPVILEPPISRGSAWAYPWLGLLIGAGVGFFVIHPLTMVVREIQTFAVQGRPLQLGQAILISFSAPMWPMTALYTILGLIVGLVLGIFLQRLDKHRRQLQTLNQEFELQVAALRHHYKNLAIGIQGFSGRIKRKLEALETRLHHCSVEKDDSCRMLQEECRALASNVDILDDAAQRLTSTLGQELLFLKALTSEVLAPEPRDFYPVLIRAIQDLLELRFRDKLIRVDLNRQPVQACHDSLIFAFEPYTMEVILQNLLSNSMKVSDHLQVEVSEDSHWVRVTISDNGPGLEVEKLRNHLLAPGDRECSDSTHLGLKVSLHLMARSGGRLSVQSEPGAGATFILEFSKLSF